MTSNASSDPDPTASSHKRYIDAIEAGDVPAIVSIFCEDAILMPPNEPSLYGKKEVTEWHEEYFQHFRIAVHSQTEREVTVIDGEFAVERRAHMVAIAPINGGERIRDDGRWLVLWKREPDGIWKISQAMFNSIRPIGSGTSRFLARMNERTGRKATKTSGGDPVPE